MWDEGAHRCHGRHPDRSPSTVAHNDRVAILVRTEGLPCKVDPHPNHITVAVGLLPLPLNCPLAYNLSTRGVPNHKILFKREVRPPLTLVPCKIPVPDPKDRVSRPPMQVNLGYTIQD